MVLVHYGVIIYVSELYYFKLLKKIQNTFFSRTSYNIWLTETIFFLKFNMKSSGNYPIFTILLNRNCIMKEMGLIIGLFLALFVQNGLAQNEITAKIPANGAVGVNTGILRWSGRDGVQYDLYFGLTPNPGLYKSDLQAMEEKPFILELNKKYYWKVAEKKDGKVIRSSKVFSFSTLPIVLNPSVGYTPFVDERDYTIYWTTEVNGTVWFAQNLDFAWADLSWYYDNSSANKVYGRLYSGHTLKTKPDSICPTGWHVPSQLEWMETINSTGGVKTAGKQWKEASDLYWRSSKNERNNKSGMTVLPAGSRDSKPSFANLGKYTFFWTSTPNPQIPGSYYSFDFGFMRDNITIGPGDPNWSYSIRCVKDK
jgi:uncharacterized protein (TIGR02145 family)